MVRLQLGHGDDDVGPLQGLGQPETAERREPQAVGGEEDVFVVEVDEREFRFGEGPAQAGLVEDPVGIPAMSLPLGDEHLAGPERPEHLGCRTHQSGMGVDVGRFRLGSTRFGLSRTDFPETQAGMDSELRESLADLLREINFIRIGPGDEDRRPPRPLVGVVNESGPKAAGSQRACAE